MRHGHYIGNHVFVNPLLLLFVMSCGSRGGVAAGDLSLEPKNPDAFENTSGFSMQILIDLQKVICSLRLIKAECDGVSLSNLEKMHCKEAGASSDYSSRVTLALRQSSAWKYLGVKL